MLNYFYIVSASSFLNEVNEKFNAWTDKFTSNGVLASFVTLGLFILLCIVINNYSNK